MVDARYRVMIFLKRRPGMAVAEFRDYYENHHLPLVRRYASGLADYRRSYIRWLDHLDTHEPCEAQFDVVTELIYDDKTKLESLIGMVERGRLPDDVLQDEFLLFDRAATRYVVVEQEDQG